MPVSEFVCLSQIRRAVTHLMGTAFVSAGPPSLLSALEALSDKGIQSPAVASLFVAPGMMAELVVAACLDLPVADPLGVSPAFVELLLTQARVLVEAT